VICGRCDRVIVDGPCPCRAGDQARLAAEVERRHAEAVRMAVHGPRGRAALPDPPPHAHWLADPRWDPAHLVDATSESLCGKVTAGAGTQPAPVRAKPCRSCLQAAGLDE
jgi:hypothetical protein